VLHTFLGASSLLQSFNEEVVVPFIQGKQNKLYIIRHEASMSALLYRRLWENLSYKARFSQRRQGAKLAEDSNRFVLTQLRCVIVERNESHPARNKFRQADA
jgi:hypothetical protein